MDFKILPFELKSADGDGSTFAGYANVFNNIDSAQEIVAPGAFTDTITDFLTSGFIGGLNHQWDSPIGKPTSAREDSKGLFIEAKISNTQHGQDCKVLLKDGVITKMSIGYRVLGDEYLENADDVKAYWKDAAYKPNAQDIAKSQMGARLLTRLFLYEASPVSVPANDMADITRVKHYTAPQITSERQFEKFLRDAGYSKSAAVTICVSGFKALHRRDAEEGTDTAEVEQEDIPQVADTEPIAIDTPSVETAPSEDTEQTEQISVIETPPTSTEETAVFVAPVAETGETSETEKAADVVTDIKTIVSSDDQAKIRSLYASLLNRQAAQYAPIPPRSN